MIAVLLGAGLAPAQPASPAPRTLRVASITQWVVDQYRRSLPGLLPALNGGVQDRAVFFWQRGKIQRVSLAPKGIRLLAPDEAGPLGGRGEVRLATLQYASGASAWNVVTLGGAGEGSRALVELGGELNTERQVLETLLVVHPDGAVVRVPLSPGALIPGPGVPVVRRGPGQLTPDLPFGPAGDGIEILVVRSTVETVIDGAVTPGGLADVAANPGNGGGDWRVADRVVMRVPLGGGSASPVALVMGWKDRVLRPDPDAELPIRSAIPRSADPS